MPLHDWSVDRRWEAVRTAPRSPAELPAGAEAFGVPDQEVATPELDPQPALYMLRAGRMVAAVELASPRNKDRPDGRGHYLARYLSYIREGTHLLWVDVHRQPTRSSFADEQSARRCRPCRRR